jgi:hypothetical protein
LTFTTFVCWRFSCWLNAHENMAFLLLWTSTDVAMQALSGCYWCSLNLAKLNLKKTPLCTTYKRAPLSWLKNSPLFKRLCSVLTFS